MALYTGTLVKPISEEAARNLRMDEIDPQIPEASQHLPKEAVRNAISAFTKPSPRSAG
jgi:hypothetical protein